MDISPTTTTFEDAANRPWLGSKHGIDCTDTVTLKVSTFAKVGGRIVSGVPIVKAVDDLYEQAPLTGPCDGHLFEDVIVRGDSTTAGGALFWHGKVIAAQVPLAGFADAAETAGADQIRYV